MITSKKCQRKLTIKPKSKNVLIVGGAGYIGSHTTLALKEAGYRTVVYDNFSTGHHDACFGDALIKAGLENTACLTDTLITHKIDCVVHFAALIEAGESMTNPLPFFENNVSGTLSLLNAMNNAGVKRIVFSSTAAVYGNNTDQPLLSEDLPRAPINPYGHSKAMVETVLEACVAAHDISAIALRYFNASGADPDGRTGERHDPETHLIPLIIQAARNERDQIKVYGIDYPTPDGTCIRDYIHVSDLASGHVAAVSRLLNSDKPGFTAMNLGTGTGQSVREVIEAVKRVSGMEFKVVETERRLGDPAALVADPNKAHSKLGWSATNSTIDQIVRDAWVYETAQKGDVEL